MHSSMDCSSDTESDSSSPGWASGTTSPGMGWRSDTASLSSDNEYRYVDFDGEDQMWADMDQVLTDGGNLSSMRLPTDFGDHSDPQQAARAIAANAFSQTTTAGATQLVAPVLSPQPKAKPLRMTVQDGHRAGDVCYARVPSTGQRVAGHVPAGLILGDQFIVMYVPEVDGSPSVKGGEAGPQTEAEDAAVAAAAVEKARDLARQLDVPELLTLLTTPTWGSAEPPTRPLRFYDPIPEVLFREPRLLKRRQKVSFGVIDRWKNSGGKHAVVTMPISPEHKRMAGENNVLVARHGRVLRADGMLLRYRQWSFGTQSPSGELKESNKEDFIVYQVFAESKKEDPISAAIEREPSPPLSAEADLESPTDPAQLGSSIWPPQHQQGEVNVLDFGLLGHFVAKRTFDFDAGQEPLGGKKQKRSSFAPFLIGLCVFTFVGASAYNLSGTSTVSAVPGREEAGVPVPAPVCEEHATFSADDGPCAPCSQCIGGTVATACTVTADTRCAVWQDHTDTGPMNLPFQVAQFATIFDDGETMYAFGGMHEATSAAPGGMEESQCPQAGHGGALSNQLWARDSKNKWSLVSGGTAQSLLHTQITQVGSTGWPAVRSSAANWNIPSEISDANVLKPAVVIFGGAFPGPCLSTSQRQQTVEELISPSDLWVYSPGTGDISGQWTLIGGEQTWAPPDGTFVPAMQQGYLTLPTIGAALQQADAASPLMWPLGRHDAQTWVIDGGLLMFSGAMDMYVRAPETTCSPVLSAASSQQSRCMCKNAYLLNDYWRMEIGKDSMLWQNGGGLEAGTDAVPRPQQPGPRVFGATWVSVNTTVETAWLFGGVGSSYSEGQAIRGSAVAAHADGFYGSALRSLCDLWVYVTPRNVGADESLVASSPWHLVGSCESDAPMLAQHGIDSRYGSDRVPAHTGSDMSHMLLMESVFATTWVDADQNLWLFGGADCGGVGCADIVQDRLNPPALSCGGGHRRMQYSPGGFNAGSGGYSGRGGYPTPPPPPTPNYSGGGGYPAPSTPNYGGGAYLTPPPAPPPTPLGYAPPPDIGYTPKAQAIDSIGADHPGLMPENPNTPDPVVTPDYTVGAMPGEPELPGGGFGADATHGGGPSGGFEVPDPGAGVGGGSSWMNNFNSGGVPQGPVLPRYPTSGGQPVTPVAPDKVPCTNDLWMFDTTTLVWSAHSFIEHVHEVEAHALPGDSTASAQRSWPAAECGAAAICDTSSGSGQVELVGGWRDGAFSRCHDTHDTTHPQAGADCSSHPWAFELYPI